MAVIKVMDELLANKIAAGEVVEKCASVVKELVENSIDANSNEIKIDLIEAGTKEIKVTDNGIGMERDDAVLAFQRHATSKLKTEDDLYHIETLGFRGEALASIASVSKVTLKTCKNEVGTTVEIQGGKIISVENSDARTGTSISVRELFYNTPARLKHLKSLYTELANITDYINKLALSHPDIRFVLTNNDNIILNTDGRGNLLKTIKDIYGINVAKKMLNVSAENRDYMINGYISLPEIHRSNRNAMVILVNGRIVRNTELNRVINDAYHAYKPDNRYPVVVLNIEVDPSLVDVNIHPTKMDIKFSNMEDLCKLITTMVRDNITGRNLIPIIKELPKKANKEDVQVNLNLVREEKVQTELFENEEAKGLFEEQELIINNDLISEEETPYEEHKIEPLPELYPVGLVHGTYIVCQNELGMYLIDEHAAKERINYENFLEKLGKPSQDKISLLFPITVELSTSDYVILKENMDILEKNNIEAEEFGVNSIIIKAHPTWIPRGFEEKVLNNLVEQVIQKQKDFRIEKFNEEAIKMLSCKMAIKANTNMSLEEMENIINDLRKCKNPYNCCHGRPSIIFYSRAELDKMFKRSGF
ncbi:MAG: DNA mismatch repair endonuclease MutL [Bacilli bacterium]